MRCQPLRRALYELEISLNLDEIDWLLVIGIICGAIASAAKEITEYLGIETVNWLVLALKVVAAFLSVVFAVLKFFRLRPYIRIIEPGEYIVEVREDKGWCYIEIPKNEHKKGQQPSIKTSLVGSDGSIQHVDLYQEVLDNGIVKIGGYFLSNLDGKLKVVIKP